MELIFDFCERSEQKNSETYFYLFFPHFYFIPAIQSPSHRAARSVSCTNIAQWRLGDRKAPVIKAVITRLEEGVLELVDLLQQIGNSNSNILITS
jgi:hypothetical protein